MDSGEKDKHEIPSRREQRALDEVQPPHTRGSSERELVGLKILVKLTLADGWSRSRAAAWAGVAE